MTLYFKNTLSFLLILFTFLNFSFLKLNAADSENFALVGVDVLSYKQVELLFNYELYSQEDAVIELSIENKTDSSDMLAIESSEVNTEEKNKLLVTFDMDAIPNDVYEITVWSIEDSTRTKNIENFVDSLISFEMPSEFVEGTQEEVIELNSAEETDPSVTVTTEDNIVSVDESEDPETDDVNEVSINIEGDDSVSVDVNTEGDVSIDTNEVSVDASEENNSGVDPELNSASEEVNNGQNVGEDFVVTNVESESKNVENLPETGPANLFIFILASILALLIFAFKFKKS